MCPRPAFNEWCLSTSMFDWDLLKKTANRDPGRCRQNTAFHILGYYGVFCMPGVMRSEARQEFSPLGNPDAGRISAHVRMSLCLK
jgi:hypothetical protein